MYNNIYNSRNIKYNIYIIVDIYIIVEMYNK